jgi:hypothetical protein
MKGNAERLDNNRPHVYHLEKLIVPFSFGSDIFLNKNLYTERELKEILKHETIHVNQKHTADIILAEIFCAINWYNPFAWLIRKNIKLNLEFLVDQKILSAGSDKKDYQYLLLRVMGVTHYPLSNNLSSLEVKRRIVRMNRRNSSKWQLLRFYLFIPAFVVLVSSFKVEWTFKNLVPKKLMNVIIKDSSGKSQKSPIGLSTKADNSSTAASGYEQSNREFTENKMDSTGTGEDKGIGVPSNVIRTPINHLEKMDSLTLVFDRNTIKSNYVSLVAAIDRIGGRLEMEEITFDQDSYLTRARGSLSFPSAPLLKGYINWSSSIEPLIIRIYKVESGNYILAMRHNDAENWDNNKKSADSIGFFKNKWK